MSFLSGALIKAVLGALFSELFGAIRSHLDALRKERADVERGRLQSERDQAREGLEAQKEMAAIAARRDSEDDVLARLGKGSG